MRRFVARTLALVVVGLFSLAVAAGCERDVPPQLLSVTELTPREAEAGDHLELDGQGFPQGKRAFVTFRGTLHRPGEEPLSSAAIRAEGTASSAEAVDVLYDDALESRFCGDVDHAVHTTFTGDVEVAFAAAAVGAPPVAATLHGVTLDLRPPAGDVASEQARVHEGERALAFIGVVPGEAAAAGGVVVSRVDAGSRAERAGIVADDVLAAIDGLRVASVSDLVPPPRRTSVILTVRRNGGASAEQDREVSFDGFHREAPVDLLGAAVIVALALGAVLLFFGVGSKTLGRLEHVLFSGLAAGARRRQVRVLPRAGGARRRTLALVVAAGALVVVPLAPSMTRADLDVAVVLAVVATALVTAAPFLGALRRRGVGVAAFALFRSATAQLLAATSVGAVVLASGSMRLQELVRSQGGAPWQWQLVRSPVAPVLACALLASAVVPFEDAPARRLPEAAGGEEPSAASASAAGSFALGLAKWAQASVVGAATAALFLGAWQVPGLPQGATTDSLVWAALGSALFLAKTGVAILVVLVARAAAPRLGARALFGLAWGRVLPIVAAAAALHVAWSRWHLDPSVRHLASSATVALLVLLGAWAVARVRTARHAPAAQLNPFL